MTINWPTGTPLPDIDHDAPEWLERRQSCIGASEIAGMMGLGKYGSPASVYLGKVGKVERIDNEAMELGRAMEGFILGHVHARMRDAHGKRLCGFEYWETTYTHDDEPRMTATPDGGLEWCNYKKATIEIKFTTARNADAEWTALQAFVAGDEAALPKHTAVEQYYIQIQAQMEVLGVDDGYLCVCIGERAGLKLVLGMDVTEDEVRIIHIKRDRELGAMMVKSVGAFWSRYVEAGVCPATTDEDLEALRRAYPEAKAGSSIVRPDLSGAVKKWNHAKVKVKQEKKRQDAFEARIRAEIGDAETVDIGNGRTMTAKTTTRKTGKTFRTLRIVEPKRGKG
jgi:putative phage-type endonuclease